MKKITNLAMIITLSVLFTSCIFFATIYVKAVHIVDENGNFITDRKILDALGEHSNIGYHLDSFYDMDRNNIQANYSYDLTVTDFIIETSEEYFQGVIYTIDDTTHPSTYKYYNVSCEYIESSEILQIMVIEITEDEYNNY